MPRSISRRTLLRGIGASIPLPWLEALVPTRPGHRRENRKRLLAINLPLGLHAPDLRALGAFEGQLTAFSGLSHPSVDGGHFSQASFLTGAPHPARRGFRNSVSLDQIAAARLGGETPLRSLAISDGAGSLSFRADGSRVPSADGPSRVLAELVPSAGHPRPSILDTVADALGRLRGKLGMDDRARLDDHLGEVRRVERAVAELELARDTPPFARQRLLYDLAALALRMDRTRVITLQAGAPPAHHEISHHGGDEEKRAKAAALGALQLHALGSLLRKLQTTAEGDRSLLDQTVVLFGSNLGDADAHTTDNLPILVAGGGFAHCTHLAFDPRANEPLANLFVTILQQLGLDVDRFASSSGPIKGLAPDLRARG